MTPDLDPELQALLERIESMERDIQQLRLNQFTPVDRIKVTATMWITAASFLFGVIWKITHP